MKPSLVAGLALGMVLLLALGAESQQAPKLYQMTGCLKAVSTPGTYMLTDLATGLKTLGIVPSTVSLAPHIGHKVEITGTAVPESEARKENKTCRRPLST